MSAPMSEQAVRELVDRETATLRQLIRQLQGSAVNDNDAAVGPYAAVGTAFTALAGGATVVAPADGVYWLSFGGSGSGSTAATYVYLAPAVNGVTQGVNAYQQVQTNGSFVSMASAMPLTLVKGDVVELRGRASGGTFTPDYTWLRLQGRAA